MAEAKLIEAMARGVHQKEFGDWIEGDHPSRDQKWSRVLARAALSAAEEAGWQLWEPTEAIKWAWDFQRNCAADFEPDYSEMARAYSMGCDATEAAAAMQEGGEEIDT